MCTLISHRGALKLPPRLSVILECLPAMISLVPRYVCICCRHHMNLWSQLCPVPVRPPASRGWARSTIARGRHRYRVLANPVPQGSNHGTWGLVSSLPQDCLGIESSGRDRKSGVSCVSIIGGNGIYSTAPKNLHSKAAHHPYVRSDLSSSQYCRPKSGAVRVSRVVFFHIPSFGTHSRGYILTQQNGAHSCTR